MDKEKTITIIIGLFIGIIAAGTYVFAPRVLRKNSPVNPGHTVIFSTPSANLATPSAETNLKLAINTPTDGAIVTQSNIDITGIASPSTKLVIITNNEEKTLFTDSLGKFSFNTKLEEGENKVTIINPSSVPMETATKTINYIIDFGVTTPTNATSASPSAIATNSAQTTATSSSKAKEILDKINNKANQLGLNQKRIYHGKIRSLGNNSISLLTDDGDIYAETSEATNFYRLRANQKTTIEFKNLKIGLDLTITGTMDESTNTLLTRTVVDKIRRIHLFGRVSEIKRDYVLLALADGTKKEVDISSVVNIKKYNSKNNTIVSGKVSEIKLEDTLMAVAYFDEEDNRFVSLRTMVLPQ